MRARERERESENENESEHRFSHGWVSRVLPCDRILGYAPHHQTAIYQLTFKPAPINITNLAINFIIHCKNYYLTCPRIHIAARGRPFGSRLLQLRLAKIVGTNGPPLTRRAVGVWIWCIITKLNIARCPRRGRSTFC